MNLGHCAIDSPPRAHFAPGEDEFLFNWRKRLHVSSISVYSEINKIEQSRQVEVERMFCRAEWVVASPACATSETWRKSGKGSGFQTQFRLRARGERI